MNTTKQPEPRFFFAGFAFPRMLCDMATGAAALRRKRESRRFVGNYYHAPPPNNTNGRGFYLEDAGQPFTRWRWADEVVNLRHKGWFTDEHQTDTMRGIVGILPHNRFLAGWSLGEGMASEVDGRIYDTPEDAAHAADSMAERAAEAEREYQEANPAE